MLSSWLLGSMNEEILAQMIECSSAKEIWDSLERLYSNTNTTKIMQSKGDLQNLKKGGMSIKDYTTKVKNLVNALNAVGCTVTMQEHIVYILYGLGTEYDSIVSVISAKSKPKPLQEVYALLLTHENRIERNAGINTDGTQPTANLTFQNNDKRSSDSFTRNFQNQNNQRNNRNSGGCSFGRGRQWNNNSRIQCQICGKFDILHLGAIFGLKDSSKRILYQMGALSIAMDRIFRLMDLHSSKISFKIVRCRPWLSLQIQMLIVVGILIRALQIISRIHQKI